MASLMVDVAAHWHLFIQQIHIMYLHREWMLTPNFCDLWVFFSSTVHACTIANSYRWTGEMVLPASAFWPVASPPVPSGQLQGRQLGAAVHWCFAPYSTTSPGMRAVAYGDVSLPPLNKIVSSGGFLKCNNWIFECKNLRCTLCRRLLIRTMLVYACQAGCWQWNYVIGSPAGACGKLQKKPCARSQGWPRK